MIRPFTKVIEVVAPSDVGSNDTLTVDLSSHFGGTQLDRSDAYIVEKRNSAGAPKTYDDTVSVSSAGVLTISEGATGFAAGDVFVVMLVAGIASSVDATASTAGS